MPSNLDDLISAALDGRAVLFVGSGFTYGAENQNKKRLPTVEDLLEFFNKPYSGKTFKSYRTASERYIQDPAQGAAAAFASLKRDFSVAANKHWHDQILSLPWKRIYTTNYDDLIEFSLSRKNSVYESINAAKDNRAYDRDKISIIHLNGMFDRFDNVNFDALIRLTDSSYISERFSNRPYYNNLRHELRTAGAVFVIGYSVPDLDIGQILSDEKLLSVKTIFVTSPISDEEERYHLQRYGEVHAIGVEKIAAIIEKIKLSYKPLTVAERFYNIREHTNPEVKPNIISDRERFDLYIYGTFIDSCFLKQSSQVSGNFYSVNRSDAHKILEDLRKSSRIIVAHGHLAAGKSIFVQQLAILCNQSGIKTYFIDKKSDYLINEIEILIKSANRNTVLIIENYEKYEREIKYFLQQYQSNVSLVLTSRTYIHNSSKHMFSRANTQGLPYKEYNLNILNRPEVAQLAGTLASPELRAAFKVSSIGDISRVVQKDCHSEMREVLVYIFRSENIRKRIIDQLSEAGFEGREKNYLLICFISRVMGVQLTVSEIEDAFFNKESFYNGFLRNNKAQEILRIDAQDYISISAAMSQFFIHSIYDPREVRDALLSVCKTSYNLSSIDVFEDLYKSCIQYGKILELFENRETEEVISFYDNAKNSSIVKANPYFWLQYAVARWKNKELDLTETCIKEARTVGESVKNFRTFQIDNFEATVKLDVIKSDVVRATLTDDIEFIYKVINSQIDQVETKFYPLRLGRDFYKFLFESRSVIKREYLKKLVIKSKLLEKRIINSDKQYDYPEEFLSVKISIQRFLR